MEELKACIASTMKSENHWGETVPISWRNLEKWIWKTEAQSRNIYLFSNLLRDVQNANDVGIDNEEDLRMHSLSSMKQELFCVHLQR